MSELLDVVCKHCGWHATVLLLEAMGAHPKKALYCSGNKKTHKHEFVPRVKKDAYAST